MLRYLIKNATIVNENKIFSSDVLIENGIISKISPNISCFEKCHVINADGLYLLPGMIDDQAHFREPGMTYKADIESESKAAIIGGVTSYMEMPNCIPPTTTIDHLNKKKDLALRKSHANYAFYLGATNNNHNVIATLKPNDVCGIKIFMGSSTGNMLVNDPEILENFFRDSPVLIATHCEDNPTILANEKQVVSRYGENIPFFLHSHIRSREACFKSSSLAVSLAKKFRSKLHVLHITTQEELQIFDNILPLKNKLITSEVCVHHLFFSLADYKRYAGLIKCNPSIKNELDRLSLIDALNNDTLDVIATDHAPHTWCEKQNQYLLSPAGLPLIQYAIISVLEHYHSGLLSLEKIVDKISHAPATIYNIKSRGFIREGYFADLVLVDLFAKNKICDQKTVHKCGWSPFHGLTFFSSIEKTFLNGILKYSDGKIVSDNLGCPLEFHQDFR